MSERSRDIQGHHRPRDTTPDGTAHGVLQNGRAAFQAPTAARETGGFAVADGSQLQSNQSGDYAAHRVEDLSLLEGLDSDPRPSFVVDLHDSDWTAPLKPCYCNAALLARQSLMDAVTSQLAGSDHAHAVHNFREWVKSKTVAEALTFQDHIWTHTAVRQRWRLVQAIPNSWLPRRQPMHSRSFSSPIESSSSASGPEELPLSVVGASEAHAQLPNESRKALESLPLNGRDRSAGRSDSVNYDCTTPDSTKNTAHLMLIHDVEWGQTPLGPMSTWDPQLRTMVNLVMDDPKPSALYVGPQYIMIYNEAFVPLMQKYHPACLGTSAPVSQAEYWPFFEGIIRHNIETGEAITHEHLQLFIRRNGILEETYFSFTFVPVIGTDGSIIAHYEPISETTREVISQRRMNTLLNAGQETALVRDQDAFWDQVLRSLHRNDKDVPFALVYSFDDTNRVTPSPAFDGAPPKAPPTMRQCLLRGSVGVPEGHQAGRSQICLSQGDEGWAPFFRVALAATTPVLFQQAEHVRLHDLLEGLKSSAFDEPVTSVVVSPINHTAQENTTAFLVIGLNPRTPYNEDYQQFIWVSSRLIETSLASVVLLEEEVRTHERVASQAAEIQERLVAELETSRMEAERREQKFQRFAMRANVGIFVLDRSGDYIFRNPAWFDIFQPAAEDVNVRNAWLNLVEPDDIPRCESIFQRLYTDKTEVSFELRLKRDWVAPTEIQDPSLVSESRTWILCSAYPELTEDGEVFEILGCVTDVSRQKYGEGLQAQRTEHALESKRRLENFIDTTSHEMRNPLTAILQCADGIIQSHIALLQTTDDAVSVTLDHLEISLEGAETIVQCAQHQTRIVDDILTMSKLDSDLLSVTPVQTRPSELAARCVKMLASEARAAEVDMRFELERSYDELQVDVVLLDPTRLLQVLINLVTNAIKFTRLEDYREVVVSVGASLSEQGKHLAGVEYVKRLKDPRQADGPSSNADQAPVYIHFTVRDTGRGLSPTEKEQLFSRFSQASPKTHIHYGGSGLGLFISRRLVEMLGGCIGFASQRGSGSTFTFYVKVPRVPADQVQTPSVRNKRPRGESPLVDVPPISTLPHQPRYSSALQHTEDGHSYGAQTAGPLRAGSRPTPSPGFAKAHRSMSEQSVMPQRLLTPDLDSLNGFGGQRNARPALHSPATPPNLVPVSPSIDRQLQVLVVEDNLVNQRVLAKQLTGLGCAVAVANHGVEALSYLERTTLWDSADDGGPRVELDVVLMDWEMPVMDGLTCVQKVRELQREGRIVSHVPIIGVTANARSEQLDQATAAGMDDVVTKPFRVQEVLARMRALIAKLEKAD